jgi:hypothetical protein
MKTQTVGIYHCISFGRVEHAVLEAEPPQCCGQTMAKACAETILEGDAAAEKSGRESESAPPIVQGRKKPR